MSGGEMIRMNQGTNIGARCSAHGARALAR